MSNLSTDIQISVLRKIWGGASSGYVFLPWLPGNLKSKEERRRRGMWKEVHFKWPDDEDKIARHLREREKDDLYFCPNLFEQPYRTDECLDPNQCVLYADLDEIDPREIEPDLRPTIAWQTSEDRYQAAWILATFELGIADEGNENHRLTAYLGADAGGWDITQLLRVPGRKNWKPDKRGQQGKLLWDNGPRYDISDFSDLPPVPIIGTDTSEIDQAVLDSLDREAIWRRVRMRVNQTCRDYMGIRSEEVAEDAASSVDGGMSGLLWFVERELADAGCTVAEIVALVRPMPFNKFKGRHDELVRLKTEAAKAVSLTKQKSDDDGALEIIDDEPTDDPIKLVDFLSMPRERPEWLVDNIWTVGSVGFISGAPKSYKSWLGIDLAVSVASGEKFLGVYDSRVAPVLYCQEEDSDIEVEERSLRVLAGKSADIHPHGYLTNAGHPMGARANEMCVLCASGAHGLFWSPPERDVQMWMNVRKGLDLTSDSWTGWLDQQCEDNAFGLVVIDTLGTTVGDTDTDRTREVYRALKPLREIANQHKCAIAIVHHFSKSGDRGEGGKRGGAKMLGSVAIHAWVESALYVSGKTEVSPDLYRVEIERESKRAPDMRFKLEVPRMGGIDRYAWSPDVVIGVNNEKDENIGVARNGHKKIAGSKIRMMLHEFGATNPERALTAEALVERGAGGVNGSSVNVKKQLQSAMQNDLGVHKESTEKGEAYWTERPDENKEEL